MASGHIVEGNTGGEGDSSRENQKWAETKVYTRRFFRGSKRSINANNNIDTKSNGSKRDDDNINIERKDDNNIHVNCTNDIVSNQIIINGDKPPPHPPALEDGNNCNKILTPLHASVSDNSRSPKHAQIQIPIPPIEVVENRVKISLASRSKQERSELRKILKSELDVVRNLGKRVAGEEGLSNNNNVNTMTVFSHLTPPVIANHSIDNGRLKRVHSNVTSFGSSFSNRTFHPLNLSLIENSQGAGVFVEKEKRTPKANQLYRNSEFLLAKDKFPPAESNKKSKSNTTKKSVGGGEMGFTFAAGKYFKTCSSLLERLMKHKHGWVFNNPVDADSLGLHDYYTIIQCPMDLGTVKTRLYKNYYKSPREFAEDVRLTFYNAMTYNPKGQDVHTMAAVLSELFEDKWTVIEADYIRELKHAVDYEAGLTTPTSRRTITSFPVPSSLDARRILDRSESVTRLSDPKSKILGLSGRIPAQKKPKAKDLNKRDMTYDEKQKLSTNLQNLPSEKLDQIIQIIKKRNTALSHHDDEIEVDIDIVDTETLWELDRFLTNFRKGLSKSKRRAELVQAKMEGVQNAPKNPEAVVGEVPNQNNAGDKNVLDSSAVNGEKQQEGNASGSSSSSSSSSDSGSSSSDSDSSSSSASGSDELPQSPAN